MMIRELTNDSEFRKDFADSVIVEELDSSTIPGELFAEFESSRSAHIFADLIPDDVWDVDSDARKQELKR